MLSHLDVLAYLHETIAPATYLEIGVSKGDSLRLASASSVRVGVDPEPLVDQSDLPSCHVEKMTSDDFFSSARPRELFGDRPVDLIFIDGMHLFEFALRDFFGAEALAGPESTIVIHDCLPIDAETSSREQTTDHWTGDVWKLPLCLMDNRHDLRLSIIDIPPSGLCIVRGVNPANHTLRDSYETLVDAYRDLDFSEWLARADELLRLTADNTESDYWLWRRERVETKELLSTEIGILKSLLADCEARNTALLTSNSWRLTAPFRRLARLVGRARRFGNDIARADRSRAEDYPSEQ